MGSKKDTKKTKNTDLLLNVNPKSRFAESIKTVRTNLAFSEIDKKMQVILVTSPESSDGKSFISGNLAVAYSQEDKKVLIIDADLRRGRQHEIFKVANGAKFGYSNLILNYKDDKFIDEKSKFNLNDYLIKTGIDNIDLIPTGPTPPNPIELLSSDNNSKLLHKLKKLYDIIIIDCPPIIGLSDAIVMTKYSDANILVISSKKTKIELVERVQKIFKQANATLTGVIINKAEVKGNSYYGYYDKYYGDKE